MLFKFSNSVLSNGSTIVQNVIQMVLKWLFFAEKAHKSLSGWGLRPKTPVYDILKSHEFDPQSAQMRYFLNKDILAVDSRLPRFSKLLVECLILLF